MNKGDKVKVLSSRNPDVLAGTEGVVDNPYIEGGVGVRIDGSWLIAGSDRGARVQEPRTVWYPENEVEKT